MLWKMFNLGMEHDTNEIYLCWEKEGFHVKITYKNKGNVPSSRELAKTVKPLT